MDAKESKSLTTTETGEIALQSLADQLSFAQRLINEKMISDTFKSPQQVVLGFQYAKALKLNEMIALKMMYVVNGKPCLYGEGPLSLCQRSGDVTYLDEFFVTEKGTRICVKNKNLKEKVWAAVTRISRGGDKSIQEDYFSIEDLARAGIDKNSYGKKKDVWEKYERIMLRYKARTMALRSKFADMIAGVPIAEYDHDFTPDVPEIKDVSNGVTQSVISAKFGKPPVQEVAPQTPSVALPAEGGLQQ